MEYQSENIDKIALALAKAQSMMETAKFDKSNPYYNNSYASLKSVCDAIKFPLSENEIAYYHYVQTENTQSYLVTKLIHSSGQWISSSLPINLNNQGKNMLQAYGAALTYLKRYALSAIVGISTDEDNDGNDAPDVGVNQTQDGIQKKNLSEEQVNEISQLLDNYPEEVAAKLFETLKKSNKLTLADVPKTWFEPIKKKIESLASEKEENYEI